MSLDKTAGHCPYDHHPFVLIAAAGSAHSKGDLVNEGGHYGFAAAAVASGAGYRLDVDDCAYYATKEDETEVLAVGDVVEFVAPGEGLTSGTVQAHDQGTKFGVVVEASANGDHTVLVKPISAFYL